MKIFRLFVTAIVTLFSTLPIWSITIISGPYLQNVTQNGVTIVWRTDLPSTAWVELAPCDESNFYSYERPKFYETELGRAVVGTVHKVTLGNLEPGTRYRYRIYSEEVLDQQPYHVSYGGVAASDVFRKAPLEFSTIPSQSDTVRFRVINDMHGDNDKLYDLMAGFDKSAYDFVFYNGDMVNFMDNENSIFDGFINRSVDLFASEIPFYMARGNHETRGNWAKNYMTYFPTPTILPYYTLKVGSLFIIVLDGGEDKPDSDIEYSRTSFFDDYRYAEAQWLKGVTDSDEFKNSPFKIVITHVPPINDKWHGPLHAKDLFLPILNKAGINLMLCAHLHRYVYCPAGTDGAEFPVIINSNTEGMDILVNNDNLNVTIFDRAGKTVNTFEYKVSD